MKRKLLSILLVLMMVLALAVCVSAATDEFVYDAARLVDQQEEAALVDKLEQISDTYDAQIVIMTIDSVNGHDVDDLVDVLYDDMGFGYGSNRDGVFLLVCMDVREYRILSNGYAGVAIDEYDIDDICDEIEPLLRDGDYAGAFNEFADQCAYYLDGYLNGFPFAFTRNLVIALVIGVLSGAFVAYILKSQLKSVRRQERAHNYVKTGSMNVQVRKDIFLYRNVIRTKRESSGSSGSSGGSSRSKGGGSF